MNDAQLRCFHVAATEESITRAAFRLGISQPTVSAQIKALEEGYGVQLFRRVGRKIELTDFGGRLKIITERIYAAQEEVRELLVGHQRSQPRASAHRGGQPYHVLPILQELTAKHPEVTFSLRAGNSAQVLDALTRYDIDVGIMADLKAGDQKFHYPVPAARRHRAAGQEVITGSLIGNSSHMPISRRRRSSSANRDRSRAAPS